MQTEQKGKDIPSVQISDKTYHMYTMTLFYLYLVMSPPPHHHNHLRPFFRDHPGEPVPEENFWTLWCKGRLTETEISTIQLGATPSGLSSAHLHHPPIFFTGRMPFLPPNQQCQSTEGNNNINYNFFGVMSPPKKI